MQDDVHGIRAMLVRRAGESADSATIASAALSVWQDIDRALSPIIGQPGVAALYKRSLYLTLVGQPALVTAYEGALRPGEFEGLETALTQQTPAQALAMICALLNTFHELLTHLIGGSLFERLLRTVWGKPSSGDALSKDSV
jgi:hypothetical protein